MLSMDHCNNTGIILPLSNESSWPWACRALTYLLGLLYVFVGLAVGTDAIAAAARVVVGATRKKRIKNIDPADLGKPMVDEFGDADNLSDLPLYQRVRIWNPVVASLTIVAFATAAPQILLTFVEVLWHGAPTGLLGPSAIIGSAGVHLFLISAACILAVPGGEQTKRVRAWLSGTAPWPAFIATSAFAVLTYLLLVIVLLLASTGQVTVGEAVCLLVFYALLVLVGWLVDSKYGKKIIEKIKKKRKGGAEKELHEAETAGQAAAKDAADGDVDAEQAAPLKGASRPVSAAIDTLDLDMEEENAWDTIARGDPPSDQQMWELQRRVRTQYPGLPVEDSAKMLAYRLHMAEPHDTLWYRSRATRRWTAAAQKDRWWDQTAGLNISKEVSVVSLPGVQPKQRVIEFSARVYAINPDGERRVRLRVIRRGRNARPMHFRYVTVNGVATKHEHFLPKAETMRFEPGEKEKELSIELVAVSETEKVWDRPLVPDVEWQPNDVFYVHLEKVNDDDGGSKTMLGPCKVCEIVYLPEESKNEVAFVQNHATVEESAGYVRLPVRRRGEYSSRCTLTYETEDVTAHDGRDYEGGSFELTFDEWEVEKYVDIGIIDDLSPEKDERFSVHLREAPGSRVSAHSATVTILSDDGAKDYFGNMKTLLPKMANKLRPGAGSWREQVMSALNVNAGDVDNATAGDCVAHVIAFPWKVLFSLVPPAHMAGGWVALIVSLLLLLVVSILLHDMASVFSCVSGFPIEFTGAIIVALGVCWPDAIAARHAAINDQAADYAVGYIPGLVAASVLFGLGFPWFIGSLMAAGAGKVPIFRAGAIGTCAVLMLLLGTAALAVLIGRRMLKQFGKAELGGRKAGRYMTAGILAGLWLLFFVVTIIASFA